MEPIFYLSRNSFRNGRLLEVSETFFNACLEEIHESIIRGDFIDYSIEEKEFGKVLYVNL